MWLVNTSTGRLKFFHNPSDVRYAILSHVWREGEQSFKELQELMLLHDCPRDHATDKIQKSCIYAQRDGYEWLWVDTCCINKESSAELSEAINSMFAWYAQADVCYAFLDDVLPVEGDYHRARGSSFRKSRWWTRGWTLQELIAPRDVVFLAESWAPFTESWIFIGTKADLAEVVEDVSGVDRGILVGELSLSEISVARRMSWASRRCTTRVEDRAYSLMGIFDVHLPTIYGEGGRAFFRLQEEIIKIIPDQSIFAWGPILHDFLSSRGAFTPVDSGMEGRPRLSLEHHRTRLEMQSLLAPSPDMFAHAGSIQPTSYRKLYPRTWLRLGATVGNPSYDFTSYGCHTKLPIIGRQPVPSDHGHVLIALLACEDREDHRPLVLLLRHNVASESSYYVGEFCTIPHGQVGYCRVASLSGSLVPTGPSMRRLYVHSHPSFESSIPGLTCRLHSRGLIAQTPRPNGFQLNTAWVMLVGNGIVLASSCYALSPLLDLDTSGTSTKITAAILVYFGLVQQVAYWYTYESRLLPWVDLPPRTRFWTLTILDAPFRKYLEWAAVWLIVQYWLVLPFVAAILLSHALYGLIFLGTFLFMFNALSFIRLGLWT